MDATTRDVAGVFDRAAGSYDQVSVDYFSVFGRWLVEDVGVQQGDRVLDVATGRGACLRPALERLGPSGRLLGLDIAAAMVARTAAETAGDRRVLLARADAQQLPALDGAWDVVLAGHVMSFLPDPLGAIRGWARALRPGGRLGLTTFTGDDVRWTPVAEVFSAYATTPDARPSRSAGRPWDTDDGLTAQLNDAGLEDVRHRTRPYTARFPDLPNWLAWTWFHGQRAAWERIPEDRRPEATDAVLTAASALVDSDGNYRLVVDVRSTTASTRAVDA